MSENMKIGPAAVAAAIADVLLDVDRIVLGLDDRVGRTDFHAARVRAMLADVRHQEPCAPISDDHRRIGNEIDELDVPVVLRVEFTRVVETVEELRSVARQLVPFFARDLAGLTADANAGIGEESNWLRHLLKPH